LYTPLTPKTFFMKIVDVIPVAMSGESRQDVGGSIAVNPNNPNEIVIATLTADPNGGPNAPVFVSTDGGDTWSVKSIVPGNGPTGTYGITVKYAGTSNELYAGIVKGNAPNELAILRTTDPAAGAVMTSLYSGGEVEQPYVAATTVPSGPDAGKDRLYVGLNDLTGANQFSSGLTSTIRQTMDALSPAPVFTSILLDRRAKTPGALQDLTPPRNGPQVRPAVHMDGTVYAVFYSWKTWADMGQGIGIVTSDVVVVRDDNWGQSADPYGSLLDSGDGQAGQRIAKNVPIEFNGTLGFEQVGGDLSIAIDPNNSSVVYVAWQEWQEGSGGKPDIFWLRLDRSTDRGQTWSKTGLSPIPNAKSPGLAINDKEQVGLIYQQLTGSGNSQRWETHLAFSADALQWSDTVLATVIATNYTPFYSFIGDYTNIMAVGDNFYGVFCAFNNPASKYFPQGVTFQRNHNSVDLFGVNDLSPVAPSIDPFFFETAFIPPKVQLPKQNILGIIVTILFGIIGDGGGAYIDGQGHIHIVGPGDPGPVWDYLVSLAEYRLATASNTNVGLEIQKLALQNVIDLANAQIAQINGQLGQATAER
jgi:hypothetical protein